jgi:hypothetical protein
MVGDTGFEPVTSSVSTIILQRVEQHKREKPQVTRRHLEHAGQLAGVDRLLPAPGVDRLIANLKIADQLGPPTGRPPTGPAPYGGTRASIPSACFSHDINGMQSIKRASSNRGNTIGEPREGEPHARFKARELERERASATAPAPTQRRPAKGPLAAIW